MTAHRVVGPQPIRRRKVTPRLLHLGRFGHRPPPGSGILLRPTVDLRIKCERTLEQLDGVRIPTQHQRVDYVPYRLNFQGCAV